VMAMLRMVFERQGEGSKEVNGLPHVCSRPVRPQPAPGPCNNVA
jgi:hypothetical protein